MSAVNPNVVLVAGLSDVRATPEFIQVHKTLGDAGIHPIVPRIEGGKEQVTEYGLATSIDARRSADDAVAAAVPLLEQAGGLVVVNDLTEVVQNKRGERLAGVPCAVGYFAFQLVAAANEVYGPGSGRAFLTNGYPDGTELFSVPTDHPVAARSRRRLLDLYQLRPVALQGYLAPAITAIKAERA